MSQLATGTATSTLSNIQGRAIASMRGHHMVVDSPPTLNGPNEELNPIDLLMSSLATCATFICEAVASEEGISLQSVRVSVSGDFDPRGICGEPFSAKVQAFRVRIKMQGPTEAQAEFIVTAFQQRCPIYSTLAEASPIEIEVELGSERST